MKKLILALFLAFAPTAAWADWQNTHWGMSVEEIQALYPEAQSLTPEQFKEQNTPAHKPELVMPYAEDGFSYKALFYFEPTNGRLSMVGLYLEPGGDTQALLTALQARYGKSVPTFAPNNPMKAKVEDWKIGDDSITYLYFPQLPQPTNVKYVGPTQKGR